MSSNGSRLRARLLLGAASLVLLLIVVHALRDNLGSWTFSAVRLQRTFALARGEPLYGFPERGVALLSIYPPVGPIAYLPTVVARRPTTAVLFGEILSLLFYLSPMLWLHFHRPGAPESASGQRSLSRLSSWLAILVFVAVSLDAWPLEYAALTVHVDAPALGLGALACAATLRAVRTGSATASATAALGAALAVWTKQVMAPLLPALWLYMVLVKGLRRALGFGAWLLAVSVAISMLLTSLFGGIEVLWDELVRLPSRHRLAQTLPAGAGYLVTELLPVWGALFAAVVVGLWMRRKNASLAVVGDSSSTWRDAGWPLLLVVGAVLVPTSVLGRIKDGGDSNALAYSGYFLLAAATLFLRDTVLLRDRATAEAARSEAPRSAPPRRLSVALQVGLLALSLSALVLLQEPGALTPWRPPFDRDRHPYEVAFRYAREHPGEVYFPRLTLVTLLAEGRIDPQGVVALEYRRAGVPLDEEAFRRPLTARLRTIAYYRDGYGWQISTLPFEGFTRAPDDPALPGFDLYTRGGPD